MIRDLLFKNRLPLLNRALDAYSMRQTTTANNIANSGTPDYKPERVRFEEQFQQAKMSITGVRSTTTSDRHIPIGNGASGDIQAEKEDQSIPAPERFASGESHVSVDREMSELAQNQIKFRLASRLTNRYFQGIQTAIKGHA
ncbi:MAG TPA: flagellar basal body rod protein FlgB [Patescibacteria group bacterium]|nr:flagellar basal body rod protein FlgB [Patescibacteria group bacterium]